MLPRLASSALTQAIARQAAACIGGASQRMAAAGSGLALRSFTRTAAEPALAQDFRQSQQQQQPTAWGTGGQARTPLWEFMPRFKGLLVDAAGTLLSPSEPAAEVYLRYAHKYGCDLSEKEVLQRFRRAYNTPWGRSTIRYVGDGRPFWRHIVQESTGCDNEEMFEAIYEYYSSGEAYYITPGAKECLERLRAAGLKTAVVSNFDTRLPRILKELGVDHLFDAVVISADLAMEKPNPNIFHAACERLGLKPEECVHVGDDRRNDLYGARDAGCFAFLWGQDVYNFEQVERRLATRNYMDSLTDV